MCGIAGFTWTDENLMKKMLETLKHRGPDDEGIYSDEKVTLGHRRLSILDLTPKGHQPMIRDNGNLIIVHNGEVYNYKEIRKELEDKGFVFGSNTDTEVILHAYKEWGYDCVKKFNGMWAFVIYDRRKNILFFSRDRFGIKPLYYFIKDDGNIVFASEIKAILHHRKKWKPNDVAIFDYLMYNLTDHQDFTFFKDIYKLPKAHYGVYSLDTKKFKIKRYWSLNSKKMHSDLNEIKKNLEKLFIDSVKLRLRSDVPVGSCLSGGVDSSSIVSIMRRLMDNYSNINTFSAVYPGFEKNEEKYVDLLTRFLKVKNSKIRPSHKTLLDDLNQFIYYLEEPTRSTSQYSQYSVMKLAAQHNYKVLLDGQGSDEIFAGYPYFWGYYIYELFRRRKWIMVLRIIKNCRKKIPNKNWLNSFYFLLLPKKLKIIALKRRASFLNKKFVNFYLEKSVVLEKIYNVKTLKDAILVHINYKLEELLKWEDRNSMAFSIETRVPFLDYKFVEYAINIPSDYILKNCYSKYIFRKTMEKYVPKEVMYRRDKVGFETPESVWLRTPEVVKFVESIIYSETFKSRKYWDFKQVKKMWSDHQRGIRDYTLNLWKVIFLELWLRRYIDVSKNS